MHFRVWDGSTWVAIGPNDLAYVQKVDGGTITNSAGSDVDIPVVNNIQAGLMLPGDKNKLDTYPDDSADLEVDLGYTPAADKGTVTNSNGDDAEISLADGTNAGLMAPGDKNKIDGYPATPGDLAATLDLQAVTDNGNTTTNGASFGSGNITLNANGNAEFKGDVAMGPNTTATGDSITAYASIGVLQIRTDNSSYETIQIYNGGSLSSDQTVAISANGNAEFEGEVTADTFKYTGSAPSPALAGKEIDLVATLHLMAEKLAELGGVDVASLFVANDPAPVTQSADPADDEGASSAY